MAPMQDDLTQARALVKELNDLSDRLHEAADHALDHLFDEQVEGKDGGNDPSRPRP